MERELNMRTGNPQDNTQHNQRADAIMPNPDGYGSNSGDCGDTVKMYLKTRDDTLEDVKYQTDGCMATHLCALVVAELTSGRQINYAWKIQPEHIIAAIPDLPVDHHHCAELAVGALYRALADLRENSQKPWAKLYKTQSR